ncbi:AlbA family DNA-binding domain-containing protein [Sulfobacillus thermosulfidooxidans]|uniref:AlbA family DNA-binding domain-containing protein n=1 Tax=Sulfobacillus thermosulfidooxidans TaxID=28034 RepID=UPI0006B5B9A9|nr:ATP-binding protein [Sulfobacillus thermosulfidooxidans]
MANIFRDPLTDITYTDLEQWATTVPYPQENERLDFKREFSSKVTASIVAMANHAGGVIVIGVDEQKEKGSGTSKTMKWPPVGVPTSSAFDTLQNHCYQHIQPVYLPEHHLVTIPDHPDKAILLIRIDPQTVPRPLWHDEKGVLYRFGDANRPAPLEILRRLFS